MEEKINELLKSVKADDESAFAELKELFEPLISSETVKILSVNPDFRADEDEIRQEALMALYKAAKSYSFDGKASGGKVTLNAEKKAGEGRFSEELSYVLESDSEIRRIFSENTTPLEKQIFLMYLDRRSYKEIALAVGKSEKSVDNAIYRVKSKLKKLLM